MQLCWTKRKMLQINNNNNVHVVSYNDLQPWVVVVRLSNQGSIVKLFVEPRVDMNPQFKRIFICQDAMNKGFVRDCRPWFDIDRCHLKGP